MYVPNVDTQRANYEETQGMLTALRAGGDMLKSAAASMDGILREKVREKGVTRRLMPPVKYTNADLQLQLESNVPVVILDREHDSDVSAAYASFHGPPSPRGIRGKRYALNFTRVNTERLEATEIELMTERIDIKKLFTDNALVGFGDAEDTEFLRLLNTAADTDPVQVIESASLLTFEAIYEGEKAMKLRKRPVSTLLTTERTWTDVVYLSRDSIGSDLRKMALADPTTFNATKFNVVLTNKSEIFSDGEVWMLPPVNFLGNFGFLKDLTLSIREEDGTVRWHYYAIEGMVIGQPRSVQLIRFGVEPA